MFSFHPHNLIDNLTRNINLGWTSDFNFLKALLQGFLKSSSIWCYWEVQNQFRFLILLSGVFKLFGSFLHLLFICDVLILRVEVIILIFFFFFFRLARHSLILELKLCVIFYYYFVEGLFPIVFSFPLFDRSLFRSSACHHVWHIIRTH